MAGLAAAAAVAVTLVEPERAAPQSMVALAALAGPQQPGPQEASEAEAAAVAGAETVAQAGVAKFAFGQLGDRHEQS